MLLTMRDAFYVIFYFKILRSISCMLCRLKKNRMAKSNEYSKKILKYKIDIINNKCYNIDFSRISFRTFLGY